MFKLLKTLGRGFVGIVLIVTIIYSGYTGSLMLYQMFTSKEEAQISLAIFASVVIFFSLLYFTVVSAIRNSRK